MKAIVLNNLQLLLTILLFRICNCSHLEQLLKFMEEQDEILVVTDQISNHQIKGEAATSPRQYQLSFVNATLNRGLTEIPLETIKDRLLRIISDLTNVKKTVEFLSQIVNLDFRSNTWILVIWPETIQETATALSVLSTDVNSLATSILQQYLQSTPFVTNITIMSQLYVGFPRENIVNGTVVSNAQELFRFYEVYGLDGKVVVTEVDELGFVFPKCKCESQTNRRANLRGISLRAEGLMDPEFQNDTDFYTDKSGQIQLTGGFSVEIFRILQKALNFTSTVTIMNSTTAREMGEVSSWDGVIQRTERGLVDIGLSLTVQLDGRKQRVYFLPPTDEYIVSAFFKPPSVNAVRDIFMQPFHADLWAAVIVTWLVLASSMILFSVIRKRAGVVTECGPNEVEPDFTQNSFIWALATACQQGWDEHPVALSLRTIFISGSFTGIIAYAGYSAAIVSTLSLKIDPIRTPEALVDSNLRIGVRVGFLDKILAMESSSTDIVVKVYRRLTKRPNEDLVNVSRGFHLLETSNYAFISIRDTFYDTVTQIRDDKAICGIHDLAILQHGFPAGAFLAQDSPYKEYFRVVITKSRERGVTWRLRDFYLYKRRCLTTSDNQGQVLGPKDVFTAFMILLSGYALSFIILLMERLHFRRVKSEIVTW